MASSFTVILPPVLSDEDRAQETLKLCRGSLTEGDGWGGGWGGGGYGGDGWGYGYGWGGGGGYGNGDGDGRSSIDV